MQNGFGQAGIRKVCLAGRDVNVDLTIQERRSTRVRPGRTSQTTTRAGQAGELDTREVTKFLSVKSISILSDVLAAELEG